MPVRRRACSKISAPLEDAPPGHVSFEKLRCWKDHTIHFTFDEGASKKEMQLTIRTCNNSRAEAERICRLCYLRFEEGRSKEEVMEYRNQLLEQHGYHVPAGGRKRKVVESTSAGPACKDSGVSENLGSHSCRELAECPGIDAATAAHVWGVCGLPAPPRKGAKVASPAAAQPAQEPAAKAGMEEARPSSSPAKPGKAAASEGSPGKSAPSKAASEPPAATEKASASTAVPAAPSARGDAPEGHRAHAKVRTEGQEAVFDFAVKAGPVVTFRTSAAMCQNSLAEAQRISGLCYKKFEEGLSEQQVCCYRNCLLSGCGFMAPPKRRLSAKTSREGQSAPAPASPAKAEAGDRVEEKKVPAKGFAGRKRLRNGSPKAVAGQSDNQAGEGSRPSPSSASRKLTSTLRQPLDPLEDAPEGHEAHTRVKSGPAGNPAVVSFEYITAQGKVPFQTTVMACGGSVEEASRICRLCFLKFEEGFCKEEVLRYRNRLYEKYGYGIARGRSRVKRGAGEKAQAAPAQEDAPEGHTAYRRCRSSTDGKVVCFDHMFTPGGPYTCFQTTTNKCSGSLEEAQRICRLCFMKFEAGWTKDEVLRFREHEYRKCGLRRICRGGMFYKLGAFHRSPGPAPTLPSAVGSDDAAAAVAATPEGPEPQADGETPEKHEKRGKRLSSGGELLQPEKCWAGVEDTLEAALASAGLGATRRPQVATPWPALHGVAAAAADGESGARPNQRDGMKGLAHQLRSQETSAQSALHKRFNSRRRMPARRGLWSSALAQQGQPDLEGSGSVREVLLELEHGISPVTCMVINSLVLDCGESLALADMLATRNEDVVDIWRELSVDDVR